MRHDQICIGAYALNARICAKWSKIVKTEIGSEKKNFGSRSIRYEQRISVLRAGRMYPTDGLIFGVVFSYIFLGFSILYRIYRRNVLLV